MSVCACVTTHCSNTAVHEGLCIYVYTCDVGSSPTRGSSFVLEKVTALGVLCCFALLLFV